MKKDSVFKEQPMGFITTAHIGGSVSFVQISCPTLAVKNTNYVEQISYECDDLVCAYIV